jgi:hypothetical protein
MKNIFTFLIVLIANIGYSQCPSGNLELYRQAEIDSIKIKYPNCHEIDGYVVISDFYNEIQNLDGLSNIASIKGDLTITWIGRTK